VDASGGDTPRRVLVLAGEASGDHHAARVVEELQALDPSLQFVGLGGPDLEARGVELLAGLDDLAVMGFAEVVRHLGFFWRLERQVRELLEQGGIDLVLAVDYPGFNLRMTRAAREAGIPVLYYIAPQVWAWKPGRAARLARDAAHISVILPFEPPIFEAEGGSVSFVGHPLVETPVPDPEAIAELRAELGVDPDARLLALLPGSRRQELDRHLELFVEAADALRKAHRDLVPVLAAAPGVAPEALAQTGVRTTTRTRTLLRASHVALVKSGTSTLEAAVAGVPFVMAYRTSPATYRMARMLVRVPHIALANLVAGERVVPELLQGEATADRLAQALAPLVEGGAAREAMLSGLEKIRGALGTPGAARRVAERALDVMGGEAA
jgi:lipid-A-disaccharide synthase